MVVVGRNKEKLQRLRTELSECYGMPAIPIPCDLCENKSIDELVRKLSSTKIPDGSDDTATKNNLLNNIGVLVNNAGLGDWCDFFVDGTDCDGVEDSEHGDRMIRPSSDKMETMIRLNVLGTTRLTNVIGRAMKRRIVGENNNTDGRARGRGGRIVFVSSIMGAVPGVPGSAVYAATKAYQRSLCVSLGNEMERASGGRISVHCVMPGAVTNTGFAEAAHMTDSAIFHLLPGMGLALTPEHVAETTVGEALTGIHREVFVGRIYLLGGVVLTNLVPGVLTTFLAGFALQHVSFFEGWGTHASRLLFGGENRRSRGAEKEDKAENKDSKKKD